MIVISSNNTVLSLLPIIEHFLSWKTFGNLYIQTIFIYFFSRMKKSFFLVIVAFSLFLFTGCRNKPLDAQTCALT